MKYDPVTGHRIKDDSSKCPITWIHALMKRKGLLPEEWELTKCLFGEHLILLYPGRTVALVESEKTAVICAGFILESRLHPDTSQNPTFQQIKRYISPGLEFLGFSRDSE